MDLRTSHGTAAATRPAFRRPFVLALAWAVLAVAAACPQEPEPAPAGGLFVSVPSPITGEAVNRIEQQLKEAFGRQGRALRTVVFDFTPDGQPVATSRAGACLDLHKLIQDLRLGRAFAESGPVTPIAYLRQKVSKHAVLPVLACSDLIMGSEAALGEVPADDAVAVLAFEKLAETTPAPDLVRRLLNPTLTVRKVKTTRGVEYLSDERVKARQKEGERIEVLETPAALQPGVALLGATDARQFGLCKAIYDSRKQLAEALGLPARSLREDPLAGRTPVPWLVEVTGAVDASKVESLRRRVRQVLQSGGNLIFLKLDCEGGDPAVAAPFVTALDYWQDGKREQPLKFVAYVPPGRSLGAATFLALGCPDIVMAGDARLGDFAALEGRPDLKQTREALTAVARDHGYPARLFEATLDGTLVLMRARSKQDPRVTRLLTKEEIDRSGGAWVEQARLTGPDGGPLVVDAPLALKEDVALYGDVNSLEELYARYGLDPAQVRVSGDHWLDRVAEFFREPVIQVLLILIGITGLILEVKMPGFGLPGVTAGLCFVLFFWAHSFVGQFTMLAVLLFLFGLVLLGVEVFVLPGFGVAGVSGILLMIVSLALVTLEKMPETGEEWVGLGGTLTTFTLSLAAAVGVAVVIASFLPHIPYANRLMLAPPGEDEDTPDESDHGTPDYAGLLGAIGIAETPLRPAGKVRFGDEYLDVVSEGEFVTPGSRVQVVEVEGHRVVVKQV